MKLNAGFFSRLRPGLGVATINIGSASYIVREVLSVRERERERDTERERERERERETEVTSPLSRYNWR